MNKTHIKYPSINQYRNAIKSIIDTAQYTGRDTDDNPTFDRRIELPTLQFKGTPKLHGSNASVVIWPDGTIQAQSRNRILSLGNDNAAFAKFVHDLGEDFWHGVISPDEKNPITIYGEWCGKDMQNGSTIQSGVAISDVPRMFVVFDICIGKEEKAWLPFENKYLRSLNEHNEKGIYSIFQFQSFRMDIDFSNPLLQQNELITITEQVEAECPVGKFFGVSGVGEGVVWKCITKGYEDSRYWFKVKGEKHSASKVKTLAEVDIEKLKTIEDFGDRVVTENRLQQGMEYLKEMGIEPSQKTTGDFISWVFADIMKEESDVMEASELTKKDIGKSVGYRTRSWFFKRLDEMI